MPADNKTIKLYGDPAWNENKAAAIITPGMLIEVTATGEVQPNSTAQDAAPAKTFAHEDDLQGREITVDYAVGEIVKRMSPRQGDRVLAIAGAAIAVGQECESAGNGKLIPRTTGASVGTALSAAAALDDRFALEVS